jgi:hypothetical protein
MVYALPTYIDELTVAVRDTKRCIFVPLAAGIEKISIQIEKARYPQDIGPRSYWQASIFQQGASSVVQWEEKLITRSNNEFSDLPRNR